MKIDNIAQLPTSPGCYIYKNKDEKVIYVGKAKNLKKRVANYFQNKVLDSKTQKLVLEITDIDFILTNTEVEALILENNLIKKYYPKYNIDLKDAHKYAYLHLTKAQLPWIEVERSRRGDGEFYGPFVSGAIRKSIQDLLSRNFRIFTRKPSPQLRKATDKESYLKRIGQARKILKGQVDELIDELKMEMEIAAKKTYYEHALNLRRQIAALESLKEKQRIEFSQSLDSNIINYVIAGDKVYLLVFSIRKGVLEGKQSYEFDYSEGFLNEFILRFYDTAPIPNELIIPDSVDPTLSDYLKLKKGKKVNIIIPQNGDKSQLLELVLKNIRATFFAGKEKLIELQNSLDLPKLPVKMECFDISHLTGTNTVASMVAFNNGMPDKSNYRRFRIRSPTEGDDFWAMREVITRRYCRVKNENLKRPDLIIIDGGLGQLYAGVQVLRELNLDIPIISLAKKFEEIYIPGKSEPIRLPKSNKGLHVLQAIRDEAHRFALRYQRLLRSKRFIE